MMQTEDLKSLSPALFETEKSQMSSKEFQRMLYSWFEEKGLVSDLRSYLRVLMINELKNTRVGKSDPKANFSLSKQAFSLVIAEHLLREGCHYTLSIFSTEVPGVANQLPFSLFEAHCRNEKWRFDQESLLNVLELIGISKGSSECLRIASVYFTNSDSLLTCLVNSKRKNVEMSQLDDQSGDYLNKVLTVLGVPSTMIDNITQKIVESSVQDLPIVRGQMEDMKKLLLERNNQIKLLVEEQIVHRKDNKKVKNELKEAQRRLKLAARQEHNLNLRETHIKKKLDEVTRLQKSFEKTLSKEKVEVCLQKHCNESCHSLVAANEDLKNEIVRLEEINREKTKEIERLNSKLFSFTKDLQNSKVNIEFLNSCLLRSNQINLPRGEDREYSSEEPSENITAEILKDVRCKLYALERESDELDVKFKKLKMNDFVTK